LPATCATAASRAREILYLGRRYGAEEALAMGLVNRVVRDAELEAYVSEIVKTLCENAPLAIANSKTMIEEFVKSSGVPDAALMEAAMARCTKSADYEEGRRAFMEKRKPRFTGK
jgi:enoyl-CoA hydratase/carnithine racemase